MKQTKENTLYLPIKQIYFDAIIEGTKKEEYREIKETTYNKYLLSGLENKERIIIISDEYTGSFEDLDIKMFNNGFYPFIPIRYKFLRLVVGYGKERDTAMVEVTDITFQVAKYENGKDVRLIFDDGNGYSYAENGDFAVWNVVYHLGKVVELKRK